MILAAILAIVGFQTCLVGLLAEMVRLNRKMLEETLFRSRRTDIDQETAKAAAHSEDEQ